MQDLTLVTAIAGLVFGFVGALLGIINTVQALNRDRIRLKVTPKWLIRSDGFVTDHSLAIEVINLSYFALTVSSVGFTLPNNEVLTLLASLQTGGHLPRRLEPRTSLTAVAPPGLENHPNMGNVGKAYAKTECGTLFTGTGPTLRGIVEKARSGQVNPERL